MTNSLGNYNEAFFAQEALIQLENVMGLAPRVYRGYNTNSNPSALAVGDTINVRRPATFTAQAAPSSAQAANTESVSIVVDQWEEVKFKLTDKELSLTKDAIIRDHIRPAAVALANKIDTFIAAHYKYIPWYTVLSATPALADLTAIRTKMFDNKVPLTDEENLFIMLGGAEEAAFLNALSASGMQPNQQDGAVRRGTMGRLFGFELWANQNTPSHTSGVAADATGTIDGANAKGATTITFSGVTAGITWKAGDSFSIAGDSQRYVFATDGTDADGSAASADIYPPLKQATVGSEVITIFLGGAAKTQNIAFHRNWFALAMAPLSELGGQLGARVASVSDPITGLSLRSRLYYVGNDSEVHVALDVLFGGKVLDPNLAVRAYKA